MMMNEIPNTFKLLICGPFNTSLKMDYSLLSNTYEDFRRKVFRNLQKYNSAQKKYYIQRYQDNEKALQDWIDENGNTNTNQLLFDNPQGVTHRDCAIFSAKIIKTITPDKTLYAAVADYLAEEPKIESLTINFQENGIGTFSCFVDLKLKKNISTEGNEYKQFMQKLRDSFVLSEGLLKTVAECDQQVLQSARTAVPKVVDAEKIIDISELYPHEQSGFPLWGHSVAIFDFEYEGMLPFGKNTHNILIVSHPDGLIDMNSLSKGFIHLGWGMSLAVGISHEEKEKLASTLTQLQFYWRSAQILNDLVMKFLEKYTRMKKFSKNDIIASMNEIEKLTVESELIFSYQMDYLKMLSPLSHYLYQETAKSWRINDMINYFDSKKDALAHLHEQGEARLKESLEQKRNKMSDRLNILLSILALLTLFSWAADSIGFLDATLDMLPNLKPFLIGGKFVVIVLTPILVIGIFLFFFRVTTAMEKLED